MQQGCPKNRRGRKRLSKEQYTLRLGARFGKEFIILLRKLEGDPFLKGSHIANRFGLTREYIRQICNKIFGKGFLKNRNKWLEKKKKRVVEEIKAQLTVSKIEGNPKNSAIVVACKKIEAMGLKPTLVFLRNKPRIVLEDAKVLTVYSTKYPRKLNRHSHRLYCAFQIKHRPPETDYIITAYSENGNSTFYVFPREFFQTKKWLLIPYPEDDKYSQYKEAWHLISHLPVRLKAV